MSDTAPEPIRTRQEAEALLATMDDRGVQLDVSLSNGFIRSSKDMWKNDDDLYTVWHSIDDTFVHFTREQAIEVLMGVRSPWEGEVQEDEDDIEPDWFPENWTFIERCYFEVRLPFDDVAYRTLGPMHGMEGYSPSSAMIDIVWHEEVRPILQSSSEEWLNDLDHNWQGSVGSEGETLAFTFWAE